MNGSTVGASLFYRKNVDTIWSGGVPEKYTRLLPYIPGMRILEFGAAEGVQSLLLSGEGRDVTALEINQERHQAALTLQKRWVELGLPVERCTMLQGDIRQRFDLMNNIDTLLAVRTIYHLRGDANSVLAAAAAARIDNVVLCGNKNRAHRYENGLIPHDDGLGVWNCYSSIPGMSELLEQSGYSINVVISDGDPIVTGRRR